MKKNFIFIVFLLTAMSCKPLDESGMSYNHITGYAQKGYLISGSKVTAFAYGKDLVPTGRSFQTTISGCLGGFSINIGEEIVEYFEVKAEGLYFDEVEGTVKDDPICLEAFVKSGDTNVNLNLFTTIIKGRVKKLLESGKNYSDAKTQAQVEFLKTVNIAGASVDFEHLDITGGSDADAVLLFNTCLIQHGRSVSELETIIRKAADEFKESGSLSKETSEELFQKGRELDFSVVFKNMWQYYDENGLSKDNLPSYWKYFGLPAGESFKIVSSEGFLQGFPEPSSEQEGVLTVASLIPFNVSSDVDWITFEKEEVAVETYEIYVHIEENTSGAQRVGHLYFKGVDSNELAKKEFVQGANWRWLILDKPEIVTKSSINDESFKVGDMITVNSFDYPIREYEGNCAVFVPDEDSYTVCYPAGMLVLGGGFSRASLYFPTTREGDLSPVMCGLIKPVNGNHLSPVEHIKMAWASIRIGINIEAFCDLSYITIGLGNGQSIAGYFDVPIYSENIFQDQYWQYEVADGDEKEIRINVVDSSGWLYAEFPPDRSLRDGMKIKCYDKSDEWIASQWFHYEDELQRGATISFTMDGDSRLMSPK